MIRNNEKSAEILRAEEQLAQAKARLAEAKRKEGARKRVIANQNVAVNTFPGLVNQEISQNTQGNIYDQRHITDTEAGLVLYHSGNAVKSCGGEIVFNDKKLIIKGQQHRDQGDKAVLQPRAKVRFSDSHFISPWFYEIILSQPRPAVNKIKKFCRTTSTNFTFGSSHDIIKKSTLQN